MGNVASSVSEMSFRKSRRLIPIGQPRRLSE